MQVKAEKNLIYRGEIYKRGESFECEDYAQLQSRGLVKAAEITALPSLEEETKRKKR